MLYAVHISIPVDDMSLLAFIAKKNEKFHPVAPQPVWVRGVPA